MDSLAGEAGAGQIGREILRDEARALDALADR